VEIRETPIRNNSYVDNEMNGTTEDEASLDVTNTIMVIAHAALLESASLVTNLSRQALRHELERAPSRYEDLRRVSSELESTETLLRRTENDLSRIYEELERMRNNPAFNFSRPVTWLGSYCNIL
jgi:hypothetical protein